MTKAQLAEMGGDEVFDVPAKCAVGRADDNDIVIKHRWVSRHHCEIKQSLLGGWTLIQLGPKEVGGASGHYTIVRRESGVTHVRSGEKIKLQHGDALAFGKPHGDATIVFTHELRIVS